MLFVTIAALAGGLATVGALLPVSGLLALGAAPFGGSACALLAGAFLAYRRGLDWQGHDAFEEQLDDQVDAMVATLRGVGKRDLWANESTEQAAPSERAA